ncbi:MAG TPA: hypothetical protein DCL54_00100 [Alphaproteobacteria bacterium]|nr:hypothetical protein [Alphaproteobacteria bacterium]HAJ44966.1 hypothetical protein [Alphaproteobacteria bacterium]
MSRLSKLVELVIVVIVALMAAFGLIYGYKLICVEYGMCSGTSLPNNDYAEEIRMAREHLDACEASPSPLCTCWTVAPGGESHEYNLRFYEDLDPEAPKSIVMIRANTGGGEPVPGAEDPLNQAGAYLLLPTDEYSNSSTSPGCTRLTASGQPFGEWFCPVPRKGRPDFRVFFTNRSYIPLTYCLYHNGRTEP